MAACSDFLLDQKVHPSPNSLVYLSRAVQLVNAKLSGTEALEDVTVLTVLGLTLYEQLRGELSRWQVHVDGILRIVELRGGLHKFQHELNLIQKICRLDIDLSLSRGCATKFSVKDIDFMTAMSIRHTNPDDASIEPPSNQFRGSHHELMAVAMDVMTLAKALNTIRENKIHPSVYQGTSVSICYHLINLNCLNESRFANPLDEGLHLGLLAFMTGLMFQFGRRRMLPQPLLANRISAWLRLASDRRYDCGYLSLWILLISRFAVFSEDEESWLLPLVAQERKRLGSPDGSKVYGKLGEFPWVHTNLDVIARQMLERAV